MKDITMMQSQWKAVTASGENLNFELCKGGYFSDKDEYGLKVIGKTEQKTLTGKNLYDASKTNVPLAKYDPDSDLITILPAPSGAGNGYVDTNVTLNEFCSNLTIGATYTLSIYAEADVGVKYNQIIHMSDIGTFGHGSQLTITEQMATSNVHIYGANLNEGSATGNVYIKYQLELGDTATAYEPYCGGIPSPNPDYPQEIQCVKAGTKVRVCGKNLFDTNNLAYASHNSYTINTSWYRNNKPHFEGDELIGGGRYGDSVGYYITFDVGVGKTLTLSFDGVSVSDGSYSYANHVTIKEFDSIENELMINSTTIATHDIKLSTRTVNQITTTKRYIGFGFYKHINGNESALLTRLKNIQLELGGTATAYEPYFEGGEITVPCDLYEGDVWYPASGRVEKKNLSLVIDSADGFVFNEAKSTSTKLCVYCHIADLVANSAGGIVSGACSHMMSLSYVDAANSTNNAANTTAWAISDKTGYIYIGITTDYLAEATLGGFSTWLTAQANEGNPLTFVYQPKTPVVMRVEPQPIFAPEGTVNVLQTAEDLSADLEATMLVKR